MNCNNLNFNVLIFYFLEPTLVYDSLFSLFRVVINYLRDIKKVIMRTQISFVFSDNIV